MRGVAIAAALGAGISSFLYLTVKFRCGRGVPCRRIREPPARGRAREDCVMDSMQAFMMADANRGAPLKVFDWDKAAQLIKDNGAVEAEAGLEGDWEWTGGTIWANRRIVPEDDTYVYLASTWATPQILINGEEIVLAGVGAGDRGCVVTDHQRDLEAMNQPPFTPARVVAADCDGTSTCPAAERIDALHPPSCLGVYRTAVEIETNVVPSDYELRKRAQRERALRALGHVRGIQ